MIKSPYKLLMFPEVLNNIFRHLQENDYQYTRSVCKKWKKITKEVRPQQGLLRKFHISLETVFSLHAPELVYNRLSRIFKRGKNISEFHEHDLYQLYCAGGTINDNFVHLLDNNHNWFKQYFANQEIYFLEFHLYSACIIGNVDLARYLIETKSCKLKVEYIKFAASSGELNLVKYLIESYKKNKNIPVKKIFYNVIVSGSVDLLKYIIKKFNWHPLEQHFKIALMSGSLEMVKFFHEVYHFTGESISLNDIDHSSLAIIQYLLETMKWIPKNHCDHENDHEVMAAESITKMGYRLGMVDIIQYLETVYPFDMLKTKALRLVLQSDNLDAIEYLLAKFDVGLNEFKEIILNNNISLVYAYASGNLELIKFLLEKCEIIPDLEVIFQCAISSGNVAVVRYLIDKYQCQILDMEFILACWEGSLELITFCCHYYKQNNFSNENYFSIRSERSLMVIHHLMSKENFHFNQNTLEHAFEGYCFNKDELIIQFIQYLLNTHSLKVTQEMIQILQEKNDDKMLAILQSFKFEDADNSPIQLKMK